MGEKVVVPLDSLLVYLPNRLLDKLHDRGKVNEVIACYHQMYH